MLHFINEHLFQDEIQSENTWEKNGHSEQYQRCLIKSNGAVAKKDGSFVNADRTLCVHNKGTSPVDKTRIISTIMEGDTRSRVTIRTSEDTRYDTDVFAVAIPYDGLIIPIEDAPELLIYRAMIMKSDKATFEHEDRKYKRCLYLIVSPKFAEKGENGWYSESCDLVVKTIQSNKPRNADPTGDETWFVTIHHIKFADEGMFEYTIEKEQLPYGAIDPDELHKARICEVVEPQLLKPREAMPPKKGKKKPVAGA